MKKEKKEFNNRGKEVLSKHTLHSQSFFVPSPDNHSPSGAKSNTAKDVTQKSLFQRELQCPSCGRKRNAGADIVLMVCPGCQEEMKEVKKP